MPGLAAEVANLIVALKLDDSGFSGKMNRIAGQLKGMDRGLSQIGRGTGQVAGGIGKIATVATVAAAGGLTYAIGKAVSFEQAWAGVTKTVEGANEELRTDFEDLSRQIPLSFEELAAIGAEGGALGIATKDLLDFTDIVARLAVSTDLTAEQASSSLGQLANVLHLRDADLRDFGDSLVALGNDGASTESQILDMTARFGAAGKQAGLSNEAILALASTTASMGIEAEAGGGALSRIFNGITLDIGTATDESQVLADSMGMSLAELRTAWDQDAGKVFGELLGYINELDKFEQAEFLSNLGITNTRDINAISLLAAGVDEYGRQLGVAEGQTDELNRESQAFFDTTQGRWEIFKNNVDLVAAGFGDQLLPIINETMSDLIDWMNRPEVKTGMANLATDIADGVRDLLAAIKGADFSSTIAVLKGAADVAKAGFDAFRSLPPEVQSLALAAFGINKLTGGALTDIAKGFGNIFAGAVKLAIPLFNRGSTPANPLFVQQVGGGLGGPGSGGKPGGKPPFVPPIWAGPAAALVVVAAATQGGSDNPEADPVARQQLELQRMLDQGLLKTEEFQLLWKLAFEGVDISDQLKSFLKDNPVFGPPIPKGLFPSGFSKTGAFTLPDTAVHHKDSGVVLPDTALLPVTDAIGGLTAYVSPIAPILTREETVAREALGADRALFTVAATANAYNSRTAAASEATSRKNWNPQLDFHNYINIPVSVNTSVVQNQIYSEEIIRRGVTPTGPTEIR
jgi:TP901 family phage tail tape measure protein